MKYTRKDRDLACQMLSARAFGTGLNEAFNNLLGKRAWLQNPLPKSYNLAYQAYWFAWFETVESDFEHRGRLAAAEAEAMIHCGWVP